jgi:hypothetical protein
LFASNPGRWIDVHTLHGEILFAEIIHFITLKLISNGPSLPQFGQ